MNDATRAALIRTGFDEYEAVSLYTGSNGPFREAAVEYQHQYKQAAIAVVAPNFLRVLGARPLSGRTFADDDVTASSIRTTC